jgi:hypothetical protein
MNYTELVECLYRFFNCKGLSSNARICCLSLFHQWKRKGCPESFKMPLSAISELTNTSVPTVLTGIKQLEATGIIEVKRGGPRVPNEYKVMLKVMVNVLNISGVMLNLFIKESLTPSTRSNTNTISNNKIIGNMNGNQHKDTNKHPIAVQQPTKNFTKNKLSIWGLQQVKTACETELKELRNKGHESAFGFHYQKEDKPRAREIRLKIKDLNKRIINSDN